MNRNILNQAFVTMGYRQMTSHNMGNIYGKPVGFGIVIAWIEQNHKEITFKTACRYVEGKTLLLDSKKINIDYTDPKVGYETIDEKDLYEDAKNIKAKDPAKTNILQVIILYPGFHILVFHKISHFYHRHWAISDKVIFLCFI